MITKECMSCGKQFEADFEWRNFCPDCKEVNFMCGRWYYKYRALQLISGKDTPSCEKCGLEDIRILTINHLNMKYDRNEHGTNIFGKVIRGAIDTSKFNVLCNNCNQLYEYEKQRLFFPDLSVLKKYVNMRNQGIMKPQVTFFRKKDGNVNCPHKDLPTYSSGKCYECYRKPRNKVYYEKNKDKINKQGREYYNRNKEKILERTKERYMTKKDTKMSPIFE